MRGLQTLKIASIVLVLFTGLFLLHLSSSLQSNNLLKFINEDDSIRSNNEQLETPPITTRGRDLPKHAPEDVGSILRQDSRGAQNPIDSPEVKEVELPEDIPKPTTYLDPTVKYLSYMAYAGLTNQFIALENAATIAIRLNRTLIIPPLTANSHYSHNSNQRWSDFLDLRRFMDLTGIKVVEWNDVRPLTAEQIEVGRRKSRLGGKTYPLWDSLAENLTCQVVYGFGDSERLHTTELTFSRQFLFRPQFVRPPARKPNATIFDRMKVKDNTIVDDIVTLDDAIERYTDSEEQLLFLSHTYKLKDPQGGRSWTEAGRHFHFLPKITDYAERLTLHRAPEARETGKYIAIHVRRGDIWQKCRERTEEEMMACVTPLGFYAEAVQKAYKVAGEKLPVIVATDSKSKDDHATIAKLGWRRLSHELYTTEQELGTFGPALVDAAILANADVMVGSYSSTMSRIAGRRQKSWHGRDVLYPRTTGSWTPPL
ncbi:hypothetical protein BGZ79_002545 [Entomortierella chlamydospora]|nr:hypothetical protein BGZ79_002545 [Entomortierella chlamydospora]